MNGGGIAANTEAPTTPVYSATGGSWVTGTRVFTPASGNPSATVTVGDFASVFADGSTTPTYYSRVTSVNSTTVTLSVSAQMGTSPGTGSGISINVGGAWLGPNGANIFPFGMIGNAYANAAGNPNRVNLKNDQTYNVSASLTANGTGQTWQGYTSTFGDLGKATFDAGGNAIAIINSTGSSNSWYDIIVTNNTTNLAGFTWANGRGVCSRIVAHNIGGFGISAGSQIVSECEAYNCNTTNTASTGGITVSTAINCISHDNAGSNSSGFVACPNLINCIADSNGQHGSFYLASNIQYNVIGCDFYNNTGSGIKVSGNAVGMNVRNSNFIKNGGWGIELTGTSTDHFRFENNGYGAGTEANTSGNVSSTGASSHVNEVGAVTYGSNLTPWVDPANGDFRVSLAAAKGTGYSNFMQTASSYAGAIGYPDIGSNQHLETGGGSTVVGVIGS